MSRFNLFQEMQQGKFPSEMIAYETIEGFMFGWGVGDPPAADGFAPGALFLRVDTTKALINTGTKASPTWTAQA